jgi:sec-independent protein translocase protein TatB
MGFSETIFLFFLALLIFGPKKLPEVARQMGKILNELRRASNEFRSQIEAEISNIERQQQILPPSTPPTGAVSHVPPMIEAEASENKSHPHFENRETRGTQGQPDGADPGHSPMKVAPDA